ncbi:MAG: hypothetical protein ABUS57_16675 [Pseudomonadota bacterium]
MKLDLFRLSLLPREQVDAFELRGAGDRPLTREECLRLIFGRPFVFQHKGGEMHYVPLPPNSQHPTIMIGRVGRRLKVVENEPPEAGLGEMQHPYWKAMTVLIDPSHHADGQKFAIEHQFRVGKTTAVANSLSEYLNHSEPPLPFAVEISAIADPATFWEFVRENRGEVTSVTFELIAPNMFGQRNDLDREMRDLRDNEKARRAKLQLENPDGLELETPRVKETVAYTVEGGGAIKAKTKSKKRYNSDNKIRRVVVPESLDGISQLLPLEKVARAIILVFKE